MYCWGAYKWGSLTIFNDYGALALKKSLCPPTKAHNPLDFTAKMYKFKEDKSFGEFNAF